MGIIKSLVVVMVVGAPVASYAFSNDDSAIKDAINNHQAAVAEYAEKNRKEMPKIIDYKYGMKLDIAQVVKMSAELKECKVMPQLMTYEDSKGNLNTLQYRVFSRCRGKN